MSVGIDLATSQIKTAVLVDGKIKIVSTTSSQTPCCYLQHGANDVDIKSDESDSTSDAEKVGLITNVPAFLGSTYPAASAYVNYHNLPFEIHKDKFAKPVFSVLTQSGVSFQSTPVQAATHLIAEAKHVAELSLARSANKAVITVPTGCSRFRFQDTYYAATKSGFEEIFLLQQYVAAFTGYFMQNQNPEFFIHPRNLVLVNIGAESCDVSVFKINAGGVELLDVSSEPLGGDEIDRRLIRYCCTEFDSYLNNTQKIWDDKQVVQDMRRQCEKLKSDYVNSEEAWIFLTCPSSQRQENSFKIHISSEIFDDICGPIAFKISELTKKAIWKAFHPMEKTTDFEIVMLGSCANMPVVRKQLAWAFEKTVQVYGADVAVLGAAAIALLPDLTPETVDSVSHIFDSLKAYLTPSFLAVLNPNVPFEPKNPGYLSVQLVERFKISVQKPDCETVTANFSNLVNSSAEHLLTESRKRKRRRRHEKIKGSSQNSAEQPVMEECILDGKLEYKEPVKLDALDTLQLSTTANKHGTNCDLATTSTLPIAIREDVVIIETVAEPRVLAITKNLWQETTCSADGKQSKAQTVGNGYLVHNHQNGFRDKENNDCIDSPAQNLNADSNAIARSNNVTSQLATSKTAGKQKPKPWVGLKWFSTI